MTAKKKKKKLNHTYHGVPRDLVVVQQERSAQRIPPLWAALLSVGFDDCPVPDDGDPGGEVSIVSSTSKTATTNCDQDESEESAFYVTEEQIGSLDAGFRRFVKRMFGDKICEVKFYAVAVWSWGCVYCSRMMFEAIKL